MAKYSLSKQKETLLILIPGIADNEMTFAEKGFVKSLATSGMPVDVIAAHVHMGYLANDSIVERIEQDIIRPARTEGYKKIWFVGVSLGAFVALNYMQARADDAQGALLLAPFMGDDVDINMIKQAGGIKRWQPNPIEQVSRTLKLWYWYQQRMQQGDLQNIYLGYGSHDYLLSGIEQFAQLLPKANIKIVNGGHDWGSWSALWQQFLAEKIFR